MNKRRTSNMLLIMNNGPAAPRDNQYGDHGRTDSIKNEMIDTDDAADANAGDSSERVVTAQMEKKTTESRRASFGREEDAISSGDEDLFSTYSAVSPNLSPRPTSMSIIPDMNDDPDHHDNKGNHQDGKIGSTKKTIAGSFNGIGGRKDNNNKAHGMPKHPHVPAPLFSSKEWISQEFVSMPPDDTIQPSIFDETAVTDHGAEADDEASGHGDCFGFRQHNNHSDNHGDVDGGVGIVDTTDMPIGMGVGTFGNNDNSSNNNNNNNNHHSTYEMGYIASPPPHGEFDMFEPNRVNCLPTPVASIQTAPPATPDLVHRTHPGPETFHPYQDHHYQHQHHRHHQHQNQHHHHHHQQHQQHGVFPSASMPPQHHASSRHAYAGAHEPSQLTYSPQPHHSHHHYPESRHPPHHHHRHHHHEHQTRSMAANGNGANPGIPPPSATGHDSADHADDKNTSILDVQAQLNILEDLKKRTKNQKTKPRSSSTSSSSRGGSSSKKAAAPPTPQHYISEREITERDVICERGGKSNRHGGTKRYRGMIEKHKKQYQELTAKADKTNLSRKLIATIQKNGGRFLKKDETNNQYFVLSPVETTKKVSQALREKKILKWTEA